MRIFKTKIDNQFNSIEYSIRNSLEFSITKPSRRFEIEDYYDRAVTDHYMGNRLFNSYDRVVYIIFNSDGSVFNSYIWGEL